MRENQPRARLRLSAVPAIFQRISRLTLRASVSVTDVMDAASTRVT